MADAKLEVVLAARDDASRTVRRASDQIQSQFTTLQRKSAMFTSVMIRGAAAAAAAIISMGKAWEMAKLGARAEQERKSFERIAASYGENADRIIEKLREASANTIDTMTLINKAGTAMMMGIAPEKLHKLMEIARATARMTGQDVTKAFEDISLAVGRQSKMILDNLGIIVSVEKANQRYAEGLGKTASQLTDVEKKHAFLNETILKGEELVRRIGATNQRTTAEMFQSWEALGKNLKMWISEGLLTALKFTVRSLAEAWSTIMLTLENITEGWADIATAIGELPGGGFLGFDDLGKKLEEVSRGFLHARKRADEFIDELNLMDVDIPPPTLPIVTVTAEANKQVDTLTKKLKALAEIEQPWALFTAQDFESTAAGLGAMREEMEALAEIEQPWALFMAEEYETAANRIEKKSSDMAESIKTAITGWGATFSQQLSDMLWDAEVTFAKILESFGRMITQMIMQKMVVEPFLGAGLGWIDRLFPSAKGNVFAYGRPVEAYAGGGVVERAAIFPMRDGRTGLMGEKGPEGVLPLTRTPSGDLGVKSTFPPASEILPLLAMIGGNRQSIAQAQPPSLHVEIKNESGQELRARTRQPRFDGERWVARMAISAHRKNIEGLRDTFGG